MLQLVSVVAVIALFVFLGVRQITRPESVLPPPASTAVAPAAMPALPSVSSREGEAPTPGRRVSDEQLRAQLPPGAELTE